MSVSLAGGDVDRLAALSADLAALGLVAAPTAAPATVSKAEDGEPLPCITIGARLWLGSQRGGGDDPLDILRGHAPPTSKSPSSVARRAAHPFPSSVARGSGRASRLLKRLLPGLKVAPNSGARPAIRNPLKCYLESNRNRARFWLRAGNYIEPEEEVRNRAYFHARDSDLP